MALPSPSTRQSRGHTRPFYCSRLAILLFAILNAVCSTFALAVDAEGDFTDTSQDEEGDRSGVIIGIDLGVSVFVCLCPCL